MDLHRFEPVTNLFARWRCVEAAQKTELVQKLGRTGCDWSRHCLGFANLGFQSF